MASTRTTLNTKECSAVVWSVCTQFIGLLSPHKSYHKSLTMFYHSVRTRQANQPTLSISSQFLSLIFTISTCSVQHNLALSLGHPKCIFTLPFFSLALKNTFFLLTLRHWTPIVQDFISVVRLLPYHL